MWSTQVAALMIPLRLHSAQSGWSARKALESFVHLYVWYGEPDGVPLGLSLYESSFCLVMIQGKCAMSLFE